MDCARKIARSFTESKEFHGVCLYSMGCSVKLVNLFETQCKSINRKACPENGGAQRETRRLSVQFFIAQRDFFVSHNGTTTTTAWRLALRAWRDLRALSGKLTAKDAK